MKKLMLYFLTATFLLSCASSTQITGSWKSPSVQPEKINKILVTALTGNTGARQSVEDNLAEALEKAGYTAKKSIDVLPPQFSQAKEVNKEELLDKVKGTGVDAILTIALIDKETENRYVPGNYGYNPVPRFGYYGGFYGYYNAWYPRLYSPGYYTEEKIYFLETNLYNAKNENLIWSAQSETYDPASLASFSKEFASVVLAKMEKDGVLKKEANTAMLNKK